MPLGHDNDPIVSTLFKIVEDSPQWTPGNSGKATNPIGDFTSILVDIDKGKVATKVLDYRKLKAVYFNLNH